MYFAFQVTDAIQCDVLINCVTFTPPTFPLLRGKGSHVESQVLTREYFLFVYFVFDVLDSDNTILHFKLFEMAFYCVVLKLQCG